MYKMIVGLWLICIGSIVGMDNIDIRLESLKNQSGRDYVAIYGSGNQSLLANGETLKINQNLFTNVQGFPIAKKIVFQESLPPQYPLAACIIKTLDIKLMSEHLFTIQKDNAQIKSHSCYSNEKYAINVAIDPNDELMYQLNEN